MGCRREPQACWTGGAAGAVNRGGGQRRGCRVGRDRGIGARPVAEAEPVR